MSIKKYIVATAASIAATAAFALPALAASFTNGSFETGTCSAPYMTVNAPNSSTINNWTVSSGSVDYICGYWTSADGSRSLDMSGNGPGAISQTFDTIAGHTYTVTFDMAGNPDGPPSVKTMIVDTGGAAQPYTFDTSTVPGGASHTNMGWTPMSYFFTASGPTTTLTFTSTTATPYGPALDNVVVTDTLTNKSQCMNGGWQAYTNPSFKNQGQCIAYFNTHVKHNVTNNNNVTITNSTTQTSTTGRATVKNNTTGGNATSGDATNSNSNSNTLTINNSTTF